MVYQKSKQIRIYVKNISIYLKFLKKKMERNPFYKKVQAEIKAIDKKLKRSQGAVLNHEKNEELMQVMREARLEAYKNRLLIDTHLRTVDRCIRNNDNSTREYLLEVKEQIDASNFFYAQIKQNHKNIDQNMQNVKKLMENFKK